MENNQNKNLTLEELILALKINIRKSIKNKCFMGHDLTFSQAEVLGFIGPSGEKTMKNIADYLKITPPSATEIIAELEKKGLIKRHGDKKDRRIVFITLTDVSRKLYSSLLKQKKLIFRKMISRLTEKDKKEFVRIIRILVTE
jgi:DNA-binding MarR family transcriptional regulator